MKTLWLTFALGLALLTGCDGKDPCGDPTFAGKASDEAWMALVDAEGRTKIDDAQAVTITAPEEGGTFSAALPLKIKWTSPLSASRTPPSGRGTENTVRQRGVLARLSALFISEAWAHLPPVTGPIYSLKFTVPGRSCPVRALTTDEAWTTLKSGGSQELTLEISDAYLRENRISEGPFRPSTARKFTIAP